MWGLLRFSIRHKVLFVYMGIICLLLTTSLLSLVFFTSIEKNNRQIVFVAEQNLDEGKQLINEASMHSQKRIEIARLIISIAGLLTISIGLMSVPTLNKTIVQPLLIDSLTGLWNRTMLDERLILEKIRADRTLTKFAVLFIDLDNFKQVNDTLGHQTGDLVLKSVADRLKGCVFKQHEIYRWGGDEFLILLQKLHDVEEAREVAATINDIMAVPFFILEQKMHISCSIGISIYPTDGDDLHTLLSSADMAMYQAKVKRKTETY